MAIHRGEIYFVNLNPVEGRVQADQAAGTSMNEGDGVKLKGHRKKVNYENFFYEMGSC